MRRIDFGDRDLEHTTSARELAAGGYRALFTFGLTDAFFALDAAGERDLGQAIVRVFDDLETRFGVRVLGTFDNDLLHGGPSETTPIAYVLADVPDLDAAVEVSSLVRVRFRGTKLAKFMWVDTAVGRPLFFGTK